MRTRIVSLTAALVFFCAGTAVAAPLENQLRQHPSPYLALHGDDPVAWQEWNAASVELARRSGKPLYLSIGYFSCHWCHVMQRESYRNAQIARYLNTHFIPVKVDRELEPALDARLIEFAEKTRGQSGWPLNVFITPVGDPLYATLYHPPQEFMDILKRIEHLWRNDRVRLAQLARIEAVKPRGPGKPQVNAVQARTLAAQVVTDALKQADILQGGFGEQSKFPQYPQLSFLLAQYQRSKDPRLKEFLTLTLDAMARNGLQDQLGGGFFRYTVDPSWQTPHFEKMLYDNAQLAMIYLRAARIFNNPAYQEIAIETLDFMLSEMRVGAAFVTSTSALDDGGREGGAYLWSEAQLKAILNQDEYALLARIWGMDTVAEFDLGYVPMNRKKPAIDEQPRLKEIYAKLMQQRKTRLVPKDVKLLAGLNGLALSALTEAVDIAPRFRLAADDLRAFILENLWQNGVLYKGLSRQQLLGQGDLESYAYIAAGLMKYSQLSGKAGDAKAGYAQVGYAQVGDAQVGDAKTARKIAQLAWLKFHTPHGFLLEQKSELAKPYYLGVVEDGPLPSPSSMLIDTSLKLGDKALQHNARAALADGEALQRHGLFVHASQVMALNRLFSQKAAKLVGKKNP